MIWKPHVTVAALIEQAGKFLMVEERVDGMLVLNQPAGHIDPLESFLEAVARETLEETGWLFTPTAITSIFYWKHPINDRQFLRVCYKGCASAPPGAVTLDTDIERTLWCSFDELEQLAEQENKLRSPMVMASVRDYVAGKEFPLNLIQQL